MKNARNTKEESTKTIFFPLIVTSSPEEGVESYSCITMVTL